MLAEAPLLFSDAPPAPVEVFAGDFGICGDNHADTVEFRAQLPSGALYKNHPTGLLAKEEDHIKDPYHN